jgi:cyanophycin synthetase
VHTVEQLIELQINRDPRRGEEEGFLLDTIRLNEHTTAVLELQRQGLTATSVPEAGRQVLVMRTGNMGHDVTDDVHPDVAEMAALAARVVGLDIAGIDLVARDISQPLESQGGAIVEVNAGPSLLMHLKPAVGKPRPCGEAVVNHLFSASDSGRIPVVGVTGGPERSVVARLLARVIQLSGPLTGLACSAGLYIGTQKVVSGKPTEWEAGQRCLINRNIEAAVIENSPRSILKEGLAYDRCQVGIVTGVPTPEGMDDPYIHDMERMRLVLRTQVDVVLKQGCAVLNADDAVARGLAELCDGEVLRPGRALRLGARTAGADVSATNPDTAAGPGPARHRSTAGAWCAELARPAGGGRRRLGPECVARPGARRR